MKKAAYIAYTLVFFAACAVPGAMLFVPSQEDGSAEKRQLAALPSLTNEDGTFNTDFNSEAIAYVSDHFGFRGKLVTVDAALKSKALQYSAEPKVTIGTDGWLYYTQTLNDATGVPTVSELGIRNIAYNLQMSDAYVRSKDSELIVAIVPNKASIYPEHIPYNYQSTGMTGNYGNLAENRCEELAQEQAIILQGKAYRQKGKTVTTKVWEKWIADNSVPEDADDLKKWGQANLLPDKETVAERVKGLKADFSRWLQARQAMAAALPEEQGKSYDSITADIHSRMVGLLPDIVPYDR